MDGAFFVFNHPVVKISIYTGGFVQTNGYLVETPDGNFLVDAPEGIAAWVKEKGVRVDAVLLTHQHYDHVQDAAALQETGMRLHAFDDYSKDLTLENVARSWGMPIFVLPYRIDQRISPDVSPVEICGLEILIEHVPGHSTDSVTFYLPSEGVLFSGDTIFAGSIGRTDLPNGGHEQLVEGIAKKLLVLPAETRVFPGHGPATTVGVETAENPYLA